MVKNGAYRVRKSNYYFLSIAATDPTGEAGLLKDIKVASYLGYNTIGAVTALTVQNDDGVLANYPIETEILKQQLDITLTYPINSVKIGSLGGVENAFIIADYLSRFKSAYVVWDPVFAPSAGNVFIGKESIKSIIQRILPSVDICTPNLIELQQIIGIEGSSVEDTILATQELTKEYKCSLYLTGGHLPEKEGVFNEYFISEGGIEVIKRSKVDLAYTHGTGCTFSSALACQPYKSELERCKAASDFVLSAYR
jgi:hydroxymethylpyrimidine/phosphomethylpyrimidine kinase